MYYRHRFSLILTSLLVSTLLTACLPPEIAPENSEPINGGSGQEEPDTGGTDTGGTDTGGDGVVTDITYQPFTSTDADCGSHEGAFSSTDVWDVNNNITFDGQVTISTGTNSCTVLSNGIPNHDFNDSTTRSFAHDVSATNYAFDINRSPALAGAITEFSLGEDEGVMLNGVPISILTSTCWDTACEWRENPFYGPKLKSIDSNHAHSNVDGEYHYHGNPVDLYDASGSTASALIGYAADGFPIYGPYFLDPDSGTVREVQSSFALQSGPRPGDGTEGSGGPGGTYDGTYREDYAYVDGLGDLDECNGMTINGQYAYYVTTTFPYLHACFKGTPDASFKARVLSARSNSVTQHVHPH